MNNDEIMILELKINKFNELINKFERKNVVNEFLLKESLNDLLGQIEVTLKRTNIQEKDKRIISAIKYANNVKKHSNSIYDYTLKTLALYPSGNLYPSDDLYPSDFKIWWNNLPLDDENFFYQYNCYNEYLLNQDLCQSINNIFNIIKTNYIYFN